MDASVNFVTTIDVGNFPATQPVSGAVSVSASALPTGAATSAKQDAQTTALGTLATETTVAAILAKQPTAPALESGHLATIDTSTASAATKLAGGLPAALGGGGGLKVDGSGTALPVSAASLPLPTGAATSALQGAGLPAAFGTGGGVKIDGSGTALPVSATGLPLPSGASTAANQSTGNTSLASIDTKTPALGQALAAASVPVVLTAIQSAALAQDRTTAAAPSAVRISADGTNFNDATHPIRTDPIGTTAQPVTDNAGSLTIDSTQLPAALAANGGLKIEGVASGVPVPVSLASVPSHAVTITGSSQQAVANSITVVGPSDVTIRTMEGAPLGASWIDLPATTLTPSGSTLLQLLAAATGRRLRNVHPLFNVGGTVVNVAIFNGNGGSSVWGTYTNLIDYFAMAANTSGNIRDYSNVGKACPLGAYVLVSTTGFNAAYSAAGSAIVLMAEYV